MWTVASVRVSGRHVFSAVASDCVLLGQRMEKAKDDMIFEMGTEINLALIKAHYTDAKNRAANYKTFYEVCPSKLEVVEKLLPDGADGATIGQLHIVAQLIQMEDAHTDKTWFLALLGPKTKALYDAANALYARQNPWWNPADE